MFISSSTLYFSVTQRSGPTCTRTCVHVTLVLYSVIVVSQVFRLSLLFGHHANYYSSCFIKAVTVYIALITCILESLVLQYLIYMYMCISLQVYTVDFTTMTSTCIQQRYCFIHGSNSNGRNKQSQQMEPEEKY